MLVDCHFNIIDSWFFRESRGLDAIGAGASSSLFPPPVSTLAGALRTSIGDQLGVNWQAFAQQKSLPEHHPQPIHIVLQVQQSADILSRSSKP